MALKIEEQDGIKIITPEYTEIDAGNSGEVKKQLIEAVGSSRNVVLDLQQLQFLDSSGLGILLSAMRHVAGNGGELKVCSVTRPVQAILELVRFHRIVDTMNTREEAVHAFK